MIPKKGTKQKTDFRWCINITGSHTAFDTPYINVITQGYNVGPHNERTEIGGNCDTISTGAVPITMGGIFIENYPQIIKYCLSIQSHCHLIEAAGPKKKQLTKACNDLRKFISKKATSVISAVFPHEIKRNQLRDVRKWRPYVHKIDFGGNSEYSFENKTASRESRGKNLRNAQKGMAPSCLDGKPFKKKFGKNKSFKKKFGKNKPCKYFNRD